MLFYNHLIGYRLLIHTSTRAPMRLHLNQRGSHTITIAYIRVSSKRQVDDGVSLDAQKRRILEYVK